MILAACLRVGRAKVVKFAKYLPEGSDNSHRSVSSHCVYAAKIKVYLCSKD